MKTDESGTETKISTENSTEKDLYLHELKSLREELHALKNCQITFLKLALSVTGGILGIGTAIMERTDQSHVGAIFLFPLVILLPAWWVFFDKATTITRVVGYYRCLEKIILGKMEAPFYTGWENGLKLFRRLQRVKKVSDKANREKSKKTNKLDLTAGGKIAIFTLNTTNRYWAISYYAFCLSSMICSLMAFLLARGLWHDSVYFLICCACALVVVVSTLWNARVVLHLIGGQYSYDNNEKLWITVLTEAAQNPNGSGTKKH